MKTTVYQPQKPPATYVSPDLDKSVRGEDVNYAGVKKGESENNEMLSRTAEGIADQVALSDAGTTPKVRDLMTPEVFTLNEDDSLNLLQELMKWKRIRHVPVINDDGELTGIVTHRDFLRVAISQLAEVELQEIVTVYRDIPVKKIMNPNVMTTRPDATLASTAALMRKHKFGCLPVVDEANRLVGIITEADFLKAFEEWDTIFTR